MPMILSLSRKLLRVSPILVVLSCVLSLLPQAADRPVPPTRDPHTPGYVKAKELPDGTVPPAEADGNFIIGPTHPLAPEAALDRTIANGSVVQFTMNSADGKFYPGIAREPNTFGTP